MPRGSTMKTLFMATLAALLPILAGATLFKAVQKDFSLYKLESACVQKFIVAGYDRRQIITEGGKCRLRDVVVNFNQLWSD